MRIALTASMVFSKELVAAAEALQKQGHEIVLPADAEAYASWKKPMEAAAEGTVNKLHGDLIRGYFDEIKNCDAVLVLNYTKNGVGNYIGGNTFLEMAFAHVLNKKLFVLNPLPELSYSDELRALQPLTILDGDLARIG